MGAGAFLFFFSLFSGQLEGFFFFPFPVVNLYGRYLFFFYRATCRCALPVLKNLFSSDAPHSPSFLAGFEKWRLPLFFEKIFFFFPLVATLRLFSLFFTRDFSRAPFPFSFPS